MAEISKDTVIDRLLSIGYEYNKQTDDYAVFFLCNKTQNYIKSFCNITEIPEELQEVSVDYVCGEFLMSKKSMGALNDLAVSKILKSVQTGDTTVTYDTTKETSVKFDTLINTLMGGLGDVLLCYRKMTW